ncbi:MAG TPA: GTP 3',8-cyclase MoaA, partial [Ottowia sp.]|nr:GTP 3',8-cyclase MoaA [Ottowia sp.]
MAERVIPLVDHRTAPLPTPRTSSPAPAGTLLDARGRPLRDLRISVTD